MNKEKYEKIEAEVIVVSTEEVRMLSIDSSTRGNDKFDWNFEEEEE